MTKKFLLMALVLTFGLAISAVAYAQDDDAADTTFDDSTVEFTAPDALEANQLYTFTFEVFNAAMVDEEVEKGIWIRQVDLTLPEGYAYADEAEQPDAPACLHEGEYCDRWETTFDSTGNKITWQSFGQVTTVEYGDIREQDVQTFSFIATTDAGPANAFAWTLTGDDGSVVEGESSIGGDDDDVTPDDDASDDDDDDDSGGCGC